MRFSDATLVRDSVNRGETGWLPELLSPKITSTEFYSLNTVSQENGKMTKDVRSWTYDDEGTELRGRKFYLHGEHAKLKRDAELREDEKTAGLKQLHWVRAPPLSLISSSRGSMMRSLNGSFGFSLSEKTIPKATFCTSSAWADRSDMAVSRSL